MKSPKIIFIPGFTMTFPLSRCQNFRCFGVLLGSEFARIYGLLKIHKADTPLRPIVLCVNTFAYDLSAFLANISPLVGNSNFTVKNSTDFASTITSEEIQDHEIMVSFNIESLFTNIPIEGAIQAALQKMENDAGLADRTTLTPVQLADLLDFILRSTYFQYNGSDSHVTQEKNISWMGSGKFSPGLKCQYSDGLWTTIDH